MNTKSIALDTTFRPPTWLRGGHLQTLIPTYFPGRLSRDTATRHFVPLDDGDQIVLHHTPPSEPASRRAAMLVHGLTGCHGSPYMRRVASKLVSRGIHAFRLDMRGAGASQPHCHKMNHADRSDDLLAATHRIAKLLPDSKITVIGFSLGAAMTVRMLGAHPEQLPDQLQNALAIAPPIDLSYCCWQIQRGFNRMYDWTMARWMYRQVLDRRHENAAIQQLDTGRPPKSIRAFDSQFTAPLGGFASVDDYYTQASAAQFVPRIAVPTCILAAADDPVVPIRIFDQRQLAPSVDLWTTHHGGHLGFLAARGKDPDPWWLDWRIVDFVSSGKLPSMIGSDAR